MKRYLVSILTGCALLPGFVLAADKSIRVTEITVSDDGSPDSNTSSIDVVKNLDCDGDPLTLDDEEPFSDTLLRFTIRNRSDNEVRITRFYYTARVDGRTVRSTTLPLTTGLTSIAAGSSDTVTALFLHAASGTKAFTGDSSAISSTTGFKSVTFYLIGRKGNGKRVTLRRKLGLAFADYDRCED